MQQLYPPTAVPVGSADAYGQFGHSVVHNNAVVGVHGGPNAVPVGLGIDWAEEDDWVEPEPVVVEAPKPKRKTKPRRQPPKAITEDAQSEVERKASLLAEAKRRGLVQ